MDESNLRDEDNFEPWSIQSAEFDPYSPKKRISGPNEDYAKWDSLSTITFNRRDHIYSKDAIKFLKFTNYRIDSTKYSKDFFEFLPAEPFFPLLAKIVGVKKKLYFYSYSLWEYPLESDEFKITQL